MNRFFRIGVIPGTVVLTGMLSLCAITLLIIQPSVARLLVCLAMLCSSMGDLSLMEKSPFSQNKEKSFPLLLFGMVWFMAAHLLYAGAYLTAAQQTHLLYSGIGIFWAACILAASLILLVYYAVKNRRGNPDICRRFAACTVYLVVICLNCACVFTYAFNSGGLHLLCAAGVFFFFISDLLIGLQQMGALESGADTDADRLIWWFYPAGQLLLIAFI